MKLFGKNTVAALVCVLLISSPLMFLTVPFGLAQSGTSIDGIISQDTTWTPSGSPYILIGNALVNHGVTITIQSGVVVNLGDYYLMVNGTLVAKGASNNLVQFNRGSIIFTSFSIGWSEQALSGSIIDNANLTTTPITINGTAPKISNSYTSSITVNGGSPTISNNNVNNKISIAGGSPTISNNQIKTTTTTANNIFSQLTVYQPVNSISINGSPVISNNVITGGGQILDNYGRQQGIVSAIQVNGGSPTISSNIINGQAGGALEVYSSSTISNNIINGYIRIGTGSTTLSNNDINGMISAGAEGSMTTFKNNVMGGTQIYAMELSRGSDIITNNIFNGGGIQLGNDGIQYSGTTSDVTFISGNAFYNCSSYAAINLLTLSSVIIEGNVINKDYGILVRQSSNLTIQSNTISNNNGYGISIDSSPLATVNNNNIENNSGYSIYLQDSNNVNATYNWWGKTDQQAISQTIYDYYKDFNLGTVNYVPFLTSPDPTAPSQNYKPIAGSTLSPIPTPTPTPTARPNTTQTPTSNPTGSSPAPTSAPSIPEFSWLAILPLLAATLPFVVVKLFRKRKQSSPGIKRCSEP